MTASYSLYNEQSDSPLVITVEHAGNLWPQDIPSPDFPMNWQHDHTCYDIGMGALAVELSKRLNCPALLGRYTRLLVDLNRETDDDDLVAWQSDGFVFPGNKDLTNVQRQQRIARYYTPYQEKLAQLLQKPNRIMLSLHSFTKKLRTGQAERPWDVGVLFVTENKFARYLLDQMSVQNDICVGSNEPYDLRKVNGGTVRFHAEKQGLLNAELEFRNDTFENVQHGVEFWCTKLVPILENFLNCAQ